MENIEDQFKKMMGREGLEKLIKPTGYRAIIRHFTSKEPSVLAEFKTKKEFEEWYKSTGPAYENSAQGKIELEEVFASDSESFENLIKRNGLEGIAGREGYVFIIWGRDEEDENFKVLAEFDTKEEAEHWYNSLGQLKIEIGGEMKIDYGPSELGESSENRDE